MAAGELARSSPDGQELEPGAVVTLSGRVSAAKMYAPEGPQSPFPAAQLARLDEALTLASRGTGLDFSVYIGELGRDSRAGVESLFRRIGPRGRESVLIAVSPGERVVELVTGELSEQRLTQRGGKLAVMSMVASFKEGDLIGGLVSGLRMLDEQAGSPPS